MTATSLIHLSSKKLAVMLEKALSTKRVTRDGEVLAKCRGVKKMGLGGCGERIEWIEDAEVTECVGGRWPGSFGSLADSSSHRIRYADGSNEGSAAVLGNANEESNFSLDTTNLDNSCSLYPIVALAYCPGYSSKSLRTVRFGTSKGHL